MATNSAAALDAWLRAGEEVIAASDRAARAVAADYHRAQRGEGLRAWPAPTVRAWTQFVRSAWEEMAADGRLVLNAVQEQAVWAGVIEDSGHAAGWLTQARYRLATSAMEAHELLCGYAPHLLRASSRTGWSADAAAFSAWLARFDAICREQDLISPARLQIELASLLGNWPGPRRPLLLAGFDRILPMQRKILDLWGEWRQPPDDAIADDVAFFAAADQQSELSACARWCSRELADRPQARLLIIAGESSEKRGEIERAFLQHTSAPFEFSLGIPMSRVGLVRAASLLLRWLGGSLEEHDLDWLLASGYATATREEASALQAHMRALRRRGLQRARWTPSGFLGRLAPQLVVPNAWAKRLVQAQHSLSQVSSTVQTPPFWVGLVQEILREVNWPGSRQLTSAEFQARERWQDALDLCASLGFEGRRTGWQEFISGLERILEETLFAPESQDAAIMIAGPSESAGLSADAVWFLGNDEDSWPARGAMHPLLPSAVQREARMPHASAQLDWELTETITRRLIASAPRVRFSYARQKEGVETRASRMTARLAGGAVPVPPELRPQPILEPMTESWVDTSCVPLELNPRGDGEKSIVEIRGGSGVLTAQSQCPFKAFATTRLGAQGWERAQTGLTPAQRGQLLHAVLHSIWGASERGIRTSDQLTRIADLEHFVLEHVESVLGRHLSAGIREQMPPRYLELEGRRLTRVVTEWLEYERTRLPFTVTATEREETVSVAGLSFKLRLDRIDRLQDNSVLVIDYKTGNVSPRAWDLPRPDDVQLPLYAGFALHDETLSGLAFAKVRPGAVCLDGRVGNAPATLFAGLRSNSSLVKNALRGEQLIAWKEAIEQLARDFIAGHADVDPREYPRTCERCGLQVLCRVQERTDEVAAEDDGAAEGTNDE